MARLARLEFTTYGFGGQHSIQLSYGRVVAGFLANSVLFAGVQQICAYLTIQPGKASVDEVRRTRNGRDGTVSPMTLARATMVHSHSMHCPGRSEIGYGGSDEKVAIPCSSYADLSLFEKPRPARPRPRRVRVAGSGAERGDGTALIWNLTRLCGLDTSVVSNA